MVKKGKNGKWGYDLRLYDPATGRNSRRLRRFEFDNKSDAQNAYAALRLFDRNSRYGFKNAPDPKVKLADLLTLRLQDIANKHEQTRAARVFKIWLSLLPAHIAVDGIYTPQVRLYVDQRAADGQSLASIDRELNIISAALNSAGEYFPELLTWKVPKMPRPKLLKTRRERIITDDEYRKIVDYLQQPRKKEEKQLAYQARIRAAHLLRFALLTGMRPKEIFLLKWSDIDWDGKRIHVIGTKTQNRGNSTRYPPLVSGIVEILEARRLVGESIEYVFSLSGTPRYTDYDQIREACERNGIPYGRSEENGFELYCARHTFTTRLLQSGLSLAEVGAITGHSDREMVLYYSHIVPETTARTIDKIEAIERIRLEKPPSRATDGQMK